MPPQAPQDNSQSDVQLPNKPIGQAEPKYKNILCIEDEHFISELYERALMKAGYNVQTMVDGKQGLEEAKTNKYDIILLDIMLPTMTGIEVLKQLRSLKLKSKVIITTNLEQSDAAKAEIEDQADGYIIKAEITPKQLVDFLQTLET